MYVKFAGAVLVLYLFCSCEKKISFDLHQAEPKLVVEATIENGQPPIVVLSTTVGYFSNISTAILQNSFVHNADVFISNGPLTHKLKEKSIDIGGYFQYYYYSIDSSNLATAFYGALNSHYSLKIISGGAEYNAVTSIPSVTRRIDSLYWRPAPTAADTDKAVVIVRATDAPGFGDYIRYFTKRNSEPFFAGLNSVFDDQVIDGSTYEVQVERGWDRNVPNSERTPYFMKGDTVTLKVSNIDKATFDFWRTMEYSYSSIGNPFSSPTKVLSNINGGALGYFGGYASQTRTVIIPR
jgi:hypothetical protein